MISELFLGSKRSNLITRNSFRFCWLRRIYEQIRGLNDAARLHTILKRGLQSILATRGKKVTKGSNILSFEVPELLNIWNQLKQSAGLLLLAKVSLSHKLCCCTFLFLTFLQSFSFLWSGDFLTKEK